jgi:hypothetical protein
MDKKKVAVNGTSTQLGGTKTKFGNKRGRGEANKSSSIIYHYFICDSIKHKIYDYLYKDAAQAMFKEKVTVATPKKDDVIVNMVLVVITRS